MLRLVDRIDNSLEEELEDDFKDDLRNDFIYQKFGQAYENYYMGLSNIVTNE